MSSFYYCHIFIILLLLLLLLLLFYYFYRKHALSTTKWTAKTKQFMEDIKKSILIKQVNRNAKQVDLEKSSEQQLMNQTRTYFVKFIGMILKGLGLFFITTEKSSNKKATSCRLGQDKVSLCTGLVAGGIHYILFLRGMDTAIISNNSREIKENYFCTRFTNLLFILLVYYYYLYIVAIVIIILIFLRIAHRNS